MRSNGSSDRGRGKIRDEGIRGMTARGVTNTGAVLVGAAFFLALAGCGSSVNAPAQAPQPIAAKPDVIITLDGERHACVVALYNEAQGSTVPCKEVVPFVRDELRLPSGAIYDLRTIPKIDESEESELVSLFASLKGAG